MTTTAAEKVVAGVETTIAGAQSEKADKTLDKRRALGRGLDSLLPASLPRDSRAGWGGQGGVATGTGSHESPADTQASRATQPSADGQHGAVMAETYGEAARAKARDAVVDIRLDEIDPNPYQTRTEFDQELLEELRESILVNGVVQPIVVRPGDNGRYVLVLGERRCRASKMARNETIPAIVRRVSEQQAAEMTVVENLHRQDLNCMEQASAFAKLSGKFGLTQAQIGERVGLSRESVSNYMRLLKLPPTVMQYLMRGQLGFSEARELLRLEDDGIIEKVAKQVVEKQMSYPQLQDMIEAMVYKRDYAQPPAPVEPGARWVDPNVRAAQMELQRVLGLRVKIRDRRGKGKIVIEYSSVDDYQRVVGMLKGKSQ